MEYTRPVIIAQNKATGSYAAGCPTNTGHGGDWCRQCENTK